jgi:transposase InsO family protein
VLETDHKPLIQLNIQAQHNAKCERWRLKLQQYHFKIKYIKGNDNTMADYLSRSPIENYQDETDDFPARFSKSTQTEQSFPVPIVNAVTTRAAAQRILESNVANDSALPSDALLTDSKARLPPNERLTPRIWDTRNHAGPSHPLPGSTHIFSHSTPHAILPFTMNDIARQQQIDENTQQIITHIDQHKHYCIDNGILMRKQAHLSRPVPYIPNCRIRSDIIKIYHDTPANGSHFGRYKTTRKIQERYYWPNMVQHIRDYIRSCLPCLQNNPQRRKSPGFLKPLNPPEGIWQLLAMDFHGPIIPTSQRGYKYIISITDILSKFVITRAVRDCSAATAARFLTEDVILRYGTPQAILTDRGTHFTATMMHELFKRIGVTHIFATPYHPMTNGQVERYNATMDAKIAALCNSRRTNWSEQLPFVTFSYNTSVHSITGYTPFQMIYGRLPTLPFDHQSDKISFPPHPQHVDQLNHYLSITTTTARQQILKKQKAYKARYDLNRANPIYKLGDVVLIKNIGPRHKFDTRYEGPFRIIERIGSKTFIVQHLKHLNFKKQITVDLIIPLLERTSFHH